MLQVYRRDLDPGFMLLKILLLVDADRLCIWEWDGTAASLGAGHTAMLCSSVVPVTKVRCWS